MCTEESSQCLSFLVLACPKSGTTWMQRLLGEHPNVHCAESRLFGRYNEQYSERSTHLPLEEYVHILSKYYRPPCDEARSEAYFESLLGKLIETIASHAITESGKQIYGEKFTPYLATTDHSINQILTLYPKIRLIHLVRDCRDVIVSGMAHWLHSNPKDPSDWEIPFSYFLDSWIEIQQSMQEARDRFADVLEVRYEDMLENPSLQARRVFSFIGATVSDEVIERCVEETTFSKLADGRQAGEEDPSSFYRSGTSGQWPDRLSAHQINRVHIEAGALLRSYGYEVPENQLSP